jgi:poly(hydroxyalkanoate) depolymerase family esterase
MMNDSHRKTGRLTEMPAFGSNPGALKAYTYVPKGLTAKAPLVVVLHGCTQTAEGYDHGSGWSDLADELGFAVLYAEQQRANNPNLCFNWFVPEDIRRNSGEAGSIHQMVVKLLAAKDLDPKRVYVTGLSAGGAMAAVMLATYPEVFASGAIIGGLPFGSATSVGDAFQRMQGKGNVDTEALQRLLDDASSHDGDFPTLSVWHGTHDQTVRPRNRDQTIEQWLRVHDLDEAPSRTDVVSGHKRHVWLDGKGRERIESFEIAGMGHGVPLATKGTDGLGNEASFMLEAGISSTREIARFWGLAGEVKQKRTARSAAGAKAKSGIVLEGEIILPEAEKAAKGRPERERVATPAVGPIEKVINDALRAAGLLR